MLDWFLPYGGGQHLNDEQRAAYVAAISPFDPTLYVANAAPARLLFQFGRQDNFVPEAKALAYYEAASQPRRLELYDFSHALGLNLLNYSPADNEASQARLDWLKTQLRLPNPS